MGGRLVEGSRRFAADICLITKLSMRFVLCGCVLLLPPRELLTCVFTIVQSEGQSFGAQNSYDRFLKPVARNLHVLPISTTPAPPIYQFLPRRRLRSTTGFYRGAVTVLPENTEQIDHEETQIYQFLPGVFFEILPFSTVFCQLLLC